MANEYSVTNRLEKKIHRIISHNLIHNIKDNRLKDISIDDIRELNKRFSLSSTDHSYKVCVIDTTEDLNLSASNSLLKILEEPPKNTLFILVSNNQKAILPTILSRCQKISFKKLEEQALQF